VFFLKLTVVLRLKDHPLLQADAGLDTTVYLDLARRVIDGNVALSPGLYFVSPLYIYFAAVILAITDSLTGVRVVQAALGTAAVAFIFVAARVWFGRPAACAAAVLASLTGLFTFYETLLLQAALDPFLTGALLAALALALTRDSARWFTISGILFGIEALNRPNVLIAGAGMAALLLLRRPRRATVFAVGVLLALLPITIRNGVIAGEWSPLSSHGGLNFYIGNNPRADGTYSGVPGITPNIAGQQEDARRVAQQAEGRALDDGEVSAHFYGRGISWIRSDPRGAARLFLRKVHYTFSGSHLSLNYSFPFFAYDASSLLRYLFVAPWLLIPLGLAGLLAADTPRNWRSDYLVWLSFVPLYALSVAIFFVAERYRLPLLIPLCIGAGAGVASVYRMMRRSEWQRTLIWTATTAALGVGVNWPLGLDDGRSEARVRMAERLVQREQYSEAAHWTERALQGHPTPGVVHFRIGRALVTRGRLDDALRHLREAARLDPDRGETSYALGQALLDAGRPAEAIPHLRRAVSAGVRPDLAGFDLARALAWSGDRAAALQVLEGVTPANSDDAVSWYALGQLAQQLGAARLAARYYAAAARAAPQASEPREQLGLMLAMLGDSQGALRELESAVKLKPADETARLNLAVALAQVGRRAEAKAQAQEALRLKPDYVRAKEFLAVLGK
jgi:tetratricopeptide (TPR) repeat protein